MKRRKIKLFASVASFALVAAVMSFGVFAATAQSVAVTTNVSFTAVDVAGTISGTFTDVNGDKAYYQGEDGAVSAPAVTFNGNEALEGWTTAAQAFAEGKESFSYEFTITNTSSYLDMQVELSEITTPANVKAEVAGIDEGEDDNAGKYIAVLDQTDTAEGTTSVTFTITVSLINTSVEVIADDVEFTIALTPVQGS